MSLTRWVYQLTLWSLAFAPIITTSACVTKGTYDKKIAELETIRADHDPCWLPASSRGIPRG
jgi:hypothetical protein